MEIRHLYNNQRGRLHGIAYKSTGSSYLVRTIVAQFTH